MLNVLAFFKDLRVEEMRLIIDPLVIEKCFLLILQQLFYLLVLLNLLMSELQQSLQVVQSEIFDCMVTNSCCLELQPMLLQKFI